MADSGKLEPPKGPPREDPGAHELGTQTCPDLRDKTRLTSSPAESSDSEDRFTDAQSAPSPKLSSPIPKTRVERVDDELSYGEVPGTQAYAMRRQDAQPDEIAISQEETDPQGSASTASAHPPTSIAEEASGQRRGSHSSQYEEKRKADASPDVVLGSDGQVKEIQGESTSGRE